MPAKPSKKDTSPDPCQKILTNLPPLKMDAKSISNDFKRYFAHTLGRDDHCTSSHYPYQAMAMVLRDRLIERWKNSRRTYVETDCKRTFYLSLEFLMGRALCNTMLNLDVTGQVSEALYELGMSVEDIESTEPDAGLGNGGLGRLAACFLDSCATLQLPVRGYGLRYEYGMFRQHIANGR